MLVLSAAEIGRILLRSKLLEPQQLDDALHELGTQAQNADALLDLLLRRGLLTSYQVNQLKKPDAEGHLVLGDYALQYHNASGSFARVYRARSLRDGRMVGIKVLRRRYAQDPKAVAQFRREAEFGKTLKHENIVPIYEVCQDGDNHFLVMEFVEGGNLRDFINIRKQLSVAEATKCCLEMAAGLEYALSRGLTHRDLKMTNVLISSTGVCKLVDFGLAGMDSGAGTSNESAQRAIEYATLENGSGAPRHDPRSDLYFLGAIYYELLTGVAPLPRTKDKTLRGMFARYAGVRPIQEVNPALPRFITRIVDRLMQVNPNLRYQTPGEVVADLKRALIELGAGASISGGMQVLTSSGSQAVVRETVTGGLRAAADDGAQPVLLCLENRTRHQDVLRDYLTKRGYRVLMLTDYRRAVQRLADSRIDGVVAMADALSMPVARSFGELVKAAPPHTACVLVLNEKQSDILSAVAPGETVRVLQMPVTLQQLRLELESMLKQLGRPVPTNESESP